MKIVKIFSLLIVTALFTACNYNEDNFPGLDDMSRPKNVSSYEYTIASTDFATIVTALRTNKNPEDSITADALNSSKTFSSTVLSNRLIPYVLKKIYYSADLGSVAKVTFPYAPDREEKQDKLSQTSYVLNTDDYKQVWNSNTDYVSALTPDKSPATKIPVILAAKKPNAVSGDYAVVQYSYSEKEPEVSIAETRYLFGDFEGMPNGATAPVTIEGWINKDITGSKFWQCRVFSGNQYAQFSSNGTNEENTIYLISNNIDLTSGIAPKLSFDVTGGYYKGDLFSVLVSENFDGTEAGITSADWSDISSYFDIPTTPEIPASGYGTLRTSGEMDFSAYSGKKVVVAFKYAGNGIGNVLTTTYQIDNVKLSEIKSSMNVASSAIQYGVYQFDGSAWKVAPAGDNISILQPEDYTAMGVTNLTTAQAPNYLPVWLTQKFPFAQESTERTVVFRTSSSANYADKYILTAGTWVSASTTEMHTEQYVVSSQGWMFDPTIVLSIKRSVNTDAVQKFIDYVHNNMDGKWYPYPGRINEEHYYGFNAYYGEIAFDNNRSLYGDDEIKNLATDEEKWALFDKRAEEGLLIFAGINYPTLQTHVSGVEQLLKVRIEHFYSTSNRRYFEHTLKCIKSGSGASTPAEYEYIGKEEISGI
ncbi:MAG: DUF5017 domain-containing protein [Dysgonamonadaceae bacterium]|jgi:hypothetical protein|nr:DUF5017 domain-containing protein [Dysgonamonadaceae bacterium]